MKEYLECGRIVAAHGVRGLMKVESWCDSPKILAMQKHIFLAEKDGSYREARVESASVSGELVLMSIEGFSDRETVQGMKGTVLYLHRSDIPKPEGAVFLADMIGLPVIDLDTGATLGKIKDVTDSVASRLLVIEREGGADVLLPDIKEFVKEISPERGVYVTPIPGFFD
ncbi:MAG: 16S rRNA processing protein RimM [Clostridia bacterium]|nr:16S rRNA processing protein RimM [Clostridia bacterium]